jgi:hypothetical protein
MAMERLKLEQEQLREKPQVQKLNVGGDDRLVRVTPDGRSSYLEPTGGQPPDPNAPPVPPGMDPKIWRKERTEAEIKNQQESIRSAKAAADLKPWLDEMHDAYEAAHKIGAIGPVAGSTPGRYLATGMATIGDATGLGSQSKELEAARQRYDKAKANVNMRMAAAQLEGQGAVSNFERMLQGAQFPDLTALDPDEQLRTLKHLRNMADQTVKAGKSSPLSSSPSVSNVLDRPVVGQPAPQPAAQPIKVTTQAQYNMIPPGQTYVAPDGSIRTKGGGQQRPQQPQQQPMMGGLY